MGAIAKAQQEKQVAKPSITFESIIRSCAPQLQSVMPKGFKAERLVQMAISAYKTTPNLSECSMQSILSCCLRCATLGMEPSAVDGLGRAYIIPRWNGKTRSYEAQFQLGKNGMIELVQRSGQVSSIRTQCVFEDDDFEYYEDQDGLHFHYRPNLDAPHDDDHFKLVYLSARLKDGGSVFLAMGRKEVEQVRERSQSRDRSGKVVGPWSSDFLAMAEKTVVRRAFNRGMLPRTVEVAKDVMQDDQTPVVLDEDGYQVFGPMPDAVETEANVDPETGEIKEEPNE